MTGATPEGLKLQCIAIASFSSLKHSYCVVFHSTLLRDTRISDVLTLQSAADSIAAVVAAVTAAATT